MNLSPLTLTEAEAVIAAVPGAKLRPRGAVPTIYQVAVRSNAAIALVDRVVDLLTEDRQSRLSAALDEVDESVRIAASHVRRNAMH